MTPSVTESVTRDTGAWVSNGGQGEVIKNALWEQARSWTNNLITGLQRHKSQLINLWTKLLYLLENAAEY